jgi:DNA-binding IclR family transcriptional regulator
MKKQPDNSQPIRVNSVANALAVLRYLAANERPEGVSTIARVTEISPSSCFNILKTLVMEDFAQFDLERKTYTLGPAAIDLAIAALDPEAGFVRVRPILEELARTHRVTVGLWRRTSAERLTLIGAVESGDIVGIRLRTGQRLPMMIGAMGRCIAARSGMSETEMAKQLSAMNWSEPPKLDRYLTEVRQAGKNGFAIDDGNFLQGITSVAGAVLSKEEAVTHCIAATTFHGRFDTRELRALGCAVRTAADEVGRLLGGLR